MKASCEQVLRGIEGYLDGELSERDTTALAEHLEACPECLEHEVFLSRLRAIVRAKVGAPSPTPEELVARIRETIAAA